MWGWVGKGVFVAGMWLLMRWFEGEPERGVRPVRGSDGAPGAAGIRRDVYLVLSLVWPGLRPQRR